MWIYNLLYFLKRRILQHFCVVTICSSMFFKEKNTPTSHIQFLYPLYWSWYNILPPTMFSPLPYYSIKMNQSNSLLLIDLLTNYSLFFKPIPLSVSIQHFIYISIAADFMVYYNCFCSASLCSSDYIFFENSN